MEQFSKESFFRKYQAALIGGTAIAYQVKHRISFDLDISFPHHATLPELSFLKKYDAKPIEFDRTTIDTAINEGGNIETYHKRFSINGVKVDFVVNPSSNIYEKEILKNDQGIYLNSLKITSLDALFRLKALLLLDRNKIRDLYDIVYLLKYYDVEAKNILETIKEYQITYTDKHIIQFIEAKKADKFDKEFEGIVSPKMDICDYDTLRNYIVNALKGVAGV